MENVRDPHNEHSTTRVKMASCLFWMFRWAQDPLLSVLIVTKAEAVPWNSSGDLKLFRQTLPFTWVGLTAQLTNLALMGLNFVHMTEIINIKARTRVTAPHLLSVCTSQELQRSTLPLFLIVHMWRVVKGGRGNWGNRCRRLKLGDISTVSSLLWFVWNLRCPVNAAAKG